MVDTSSVEANLPGSILAFFYVPGADQSATRGYRDAFAGMYGGVQKPVVRLDTTSDAPFTLDLG